MKSFFLSLGFVFLLCQCASLSPQTKKHLATQKAKERLILSNTPFISQKDGDCGPSALAMAMGSLGPTPSVEALSELTMTPEKEGSLPTHMITAVRQQRLMAIKINDLTGITQEIKSGHPVVVLQNLSFSFAPRWHYAVVVGFDNESQVFYLHSGDKRAKEMPMTHFERYWELADYWAIVVLKPGQIAPSGDELSHMQAAAGLEALGHSDSAETAYKSILKRWPASLTALIGLGNIHFKRGQYQSSVRYLKMAVKQHPGSTAARNNLKIAQSMLR